MQVDKLHLKVFGDVHLGHPKTPTAGIIDNLYRLFPSNASFDCDIIFIEGDFFDRLLNLPDAQVFEIKIWINYFLRMCKRYDVVLRVLEGTPSHDWKQSRLFAHENDVNEIGADVRFVERLEIEHIQRFGIDVLYVPDEWEPETEDTWVQVVDLLKQKKLEKVDFAVMHGAFDHQLPEHVSSPTHDSEKYLSIVKHYIFIGHIHIYSKKDRIIASGSIDRLAHGEEGSKGYSELTVREKGADDIAFIENEQSKIYKTIDCTDMDVDDALEYVSAEVRKLVDFSHVRIQANRADAIIVSLETLRKKFPTMFFTPKENKESKATAESLLDLNKNYVPVQITPENITKLLLDRLRDRGWSEDRISRAQQMMGEYA